MRIAVSGAHRTGKTTLVDELRRVLPTYLAVDEPYYLLEEEGHEFAEPPSLEDFELQLQRSSQCIVDLAESGKDQIFDRCPADLLAYLLTHDDTDGFDLKFWLPRVRKAMRQLDLVVFVPIEAPDRIVVSDPDEAEWRRRVDSELGDILLGDRWDFGVDTLEVTGTCRERVRQVLACLR